MNQLRLKLNNLSFIFLLLCETYFVLAIYPVYHWIHVIPLAVLLLFCDIPTEIQTIKEFLKKHFIVVICFVIWMIHFGIKDHTTRILFIFLLFFYYGFRSSKYGSTEKIAKWTIGIMTPIIVISMVCHFLQINPLLGRFAAAGVFANFYYTRFASIFAHPIPAACVFGVYTYLCMFYCSNKYIKWILSLLGIAALFFSGSRGELVSFGVTLVVLGVVYVCKTPSVVKSIFKLRNLIILIVVIVIAVLIVMYVPAVNAQYQNILNRIQTSSTELSSNYYRFEVWKLMVNQVWPSGNWITRLFGGGNQSCLAAMQTFENEAIANSVWWASAAGMEVGTVDSTFFSVLYDYGLIGVLLLLFMIGYSLFKVIKGNKDQMHIAIIVLMLLISAATFDMEYWSSITFVCLFLYGHLTGIKEETIEKDEI